MKSIKCNSKLLGILSVFGGFLLHLSLGYFYTISNVTPYVKSVLNLKTSDTVWFSAVLLSMQAISMPFGGMLASKIGYRMVTIIAILLSSGGIFLTSLTVKHRIWSFIITYCFMFGTAMGLPYSVIFSVASSWFPSHCNAVVGVIAGGFGLGALVLTPLQSLFINPNNLEINISTHKYSDEINKNIPFAFLKLGGIILAIQIIGFILLRECPNEIANSENDNNNKQISSVNVTKKKRDCTIKESIKYIDFYLLVIIFCFNTVPITFIASTYKIYGQISVNENLYLTMIATFSSLFNSIGRVIWGLIVDKLSFKFPLGIMLFQWTILYGTFSFINKEFISVMVFKALYPIWVFLIYFNLAGHFVIMPGAAIRIFGPKHMPTVYGLIYSAAAPSSLICATITSQFNIDGKWHQLYGSCACFCLSSFILSLFLYDGAAKLASVSKRCGNICDACRPTIEKQDSELYESDISDDASYREWIVERF